jgi:rhodanese-related sulfurtransferase
MKMLDAGRPSAIHRPPPTMTAVELRLVLHAHEEITIVDVRDHAAFVPRHLPGSINCPDSQTTALVKRMQTISRAVLVCDNGRASSLVARTLGFVGFREIASLEGGIEAWVAAGGQLAETTRSGFERILPREIESEPKLGFFARLLGSVTK